MTEEMLTKIDKNIDELKRNIATLEKLVRKQGTSTELDYRITKKDIELAVWKRIRKVASGEQKRLDLSNLGIFIFPAEINQLDNLESLDISRNRLETLPIEVLENKNLKFINLSDNQFTKLPKEISQLSNLETLYINFNQLDSLPPEIGQLRKLTSLNIISNNLASLPPEIGHLTKLNTLHLGGNYLTTLPQEIGKLTNLRTLILIKNQITNLPAEINQLNNLNYLNLEINPLPIPPEIINKKSNPQSILNYYFSIGIENKKYLNESKLLVVGQGSVGKTSLVQKILLNTFDKNQAKTEGISIHQWHIDEIKLNTWDFGGQEIMHATHQFFLTKRSLYLLVLDARLTQEENRVEYWLKIIQSFGGESPVLIIGNKTDQHPLDIDRTGLQKKYPNIVGILETSAATGVGIEALRTTISEQVKSMPHVHDLLPEAWFNVKNQLEKLGRDQNFITHDDYINIWCAENKICDESSQRTLIGFLHDLGVVLYFQDDPRLESLGILNPQWVTNGVYKILNSHELFQSQGKLTLSMLNKILNLPEYPKSKHLFIVDMMKKFELCYDIETDKSFLIPDLLPKDEPFTGEWDDALAFQIHYNVLPSSIISRFIVRMNAFIHKTVWRSGVVLKRGDNTALVKADIEDKKIYIWVNGKEETRRDLLALIRGEFDSIHNTIAIIEATEKVPLPNAPEATPVDYEFLLRLAKEGRESLPVQAGDQIIDLIVKEVLSRIDADARKTEIHIHGNVENSNLLVGDKNRADNTNTKNK